MFRQVSKDIDIVLGKFNYDQCFESFVESTTQKTDTAMLLSQIVSGIKELGLISQQNEKSMRVADIGCANATASLLFLKAINHPGGYCYHGIDKLKSYVEEAQKSLTKNAYIKNSVVTVGDALCGNLSDTIFNAQKFDLVLVSHVAYYLENDEIKYKKFISDMRQLLSSEGVVFFMHGDSHAYLLSTYSKNTSNNTTSRVNAYSLLERYSEELQLTSTAINFASKLYFKPLDDKLWMAMEKTENYQFLQNNPEVMSTLEKLSFIVHRDLSSIEEEGKLQGFIRDAKEIIAQNGGFLYLHTHFQVMMSNECRVSSALIAEKLQYALNTKPELKIDDDKLLVLNQPTSKQILRSHGTVI